MKLGIGFIKSFISAGLTQTLEEQKQFEIDFKEQKERIKIARENALGNSKPTGRTLKR